MEPLPISYYVTAYVVGGLLTVGVVIALIVVTRCGWCAWQWVC